jgi:hypothetical protein
MGQGNNSSNNDANCMVSMLNQMNCAKKQQTQTNIPKKF